MPFLTTENFKRGLILHNKMAKKTKKEETKSNLEDVDEEPSLEEESETEEGVGAESDDWDEY